MQTSDSPWEDESGITPAYMRPLWSGSLSFGLIAIPVKLYSASEERALKFRLLEKHGHCPISYMKVCKNTGKEVAWKDIVKGYEFDKGDYVILTDDDFRKASPRKTKTIEIANFAEEGDVAPQYIAKPYYIEPDPKAEKAYVLLREALKRSKKIGIARFVLKEKQHIAMIKSEGDTLLLIQLRFDDELRAPEDLHIPKAAEYTKKELDIALLLISQLEEHFNASAFKDTYTDDLKKIIKQKAKGKPIRVEEEELAPTDMRDLMNILKESLEKAKQKEKAHAS